MACNFFSFPPPLASDNKESIFRFIFLSLVLYLWRRWGRWKATNTQRIRGYSFSFVNNCRAIDWVPWSPAACWQTAVSAKISPVLQGALKSWCMEYKAEYKNSLPVLDIIQLLFKLKHFFPFHLYQGCYLSDACLSILPFSWKRQSSHQTIFFFPLRSIIAIRMQVLINHFIKPIFTFEKYILFSSIYSTLRHCADTVMDQHLINPFFCDKIAVWGGTRTSWITKPW